MGAGGAGGGGDEEEIASPPTSADLIADALEAERIPARTAAHYELLAIHAPGLLPAEYRAEVPLHGAPSVSSALVAMAHLDEYPPEERAEVEALLADPEDPNWLRFDRLSNFTPTGKSCWELFGIGAQSVGGRYLGRHVDTRYFRIRALLPIAGEVQRQHEIENRLQAALAAKVPGVGGKAQVTLREYFDQSFEYYRDRLGMADPRSKLEVAARNKGEDGQPRIPLYVTTCDGGMNNASASPYGFIISSVQLALEDEDLRRVVIPHEIFHLFEFGYTFCGDGHACWPFEAAATAIEDEIAPGLRRWSGRFAHKTLGPEGMLDPMDRSFRCPEEPMHSNHHGRCKNRRDALRTRYPGDYSKFVLVKHLMRNHFWRMKDFWESYAAADADPSKVLAQDELAEFQLALLADPPERSAFDPDDRASFRAGKATLDAAPGESARYTFHAEADRLKAVGPAFRAAPGDVVSRSALKQGDARSLPIPPGGTHRMLIEVPQEAGAGDPVMNYDNVSLVIRSASSPRVSFNYVALDAGSQGPATMHRGTDSFGDSRGRVWTSDKVLNREFPFRTSEHGALPRYVLATLTNFGPSPLTYELGISFPQACGVACADHYTRELARLDCASKWCSGSGASCRKEYESKIARSLLDGSFVGGLGGFCKVLCPAWIDGLAKPYQGGGDWRELICKGSGVDCSREPAGFVPLHAWPAVTCEAIHR
ncbi:hypothetical protein AKJ08_2975 [Vulgatibacter incomptus]|uniref:Uncharacterized protein n=2 Tax=Vulgatibacter incomptus TaxID=1391653 RepID=A0A0K1PGC6_9BACT|nr:hypothetical protein AKJ08_2975 [Vulgatibacter incomptus]